MKFSFFSLFFKNNFINLFLTVLGLRSYAGFPLVAVSGGFSSLRCARFSLQWCFPGCGAQAPARVDFSSSGSWALGPRLSSCGPST